MKNFRVIKFSRFRSIREIFLTVDDCSMDERLESSWRLVYYQVSREPGIAGCSRRSDIYLGEFGLARASLFAFFFFFFLLDVPKQYYNKKPPGRKFGPNK